ncbi:hypothetical protein FHG87_020681 [Trinorchestia longiramus]|nr:hypothetical protein FHG87_020681 [Trinorchestia longiramus]
MTDGQSPDAVAAAVEVISTPPPGHQLPLKQQPPGKPPLKQQISQSDSISVSSGGGGIKRGPSQDGGAKDAAVLDLDDLDAEDQESTPIITSSPLSPDEDPSTAAVQPSPTPTRGQPAAFGADSTVSRI